jgi:hypothetical protein
MKTSKILHYRDKSNNAEKLKKVGAGNLFKSLLVVFMLTWITLLSSCAIFIPVPVHVGHGERHEHHEHRD